MPIIPSEIPYFQVVASRLQNELLIKKLKTREDVNIPREDFPKKKNVLSSF